MSFAQEGEDLLIMRLVEQCDAGFYVDIGAHHPTRFSNTYLLYKRGWRGINIDATPGSMELFKRVRPRDINLEFAVSADSGPHRLFIMSDPALNSLSEDLSKNRQATTPYEIVSSVQVEARPLGDILREYMPNGVQDITLMSVDTEGFDFEVLKSNDWTRFRPALLLIEVLDTDLEIVLRRPEITYLRDLGYVPHAKLHQSVLLIDQPASR